LVSYGALSVINPAGCDEFFWLDLREFVHLAMSAYCYDTAAAKK
jgi:hypothetical protein